VTRKSDAAHTRSISNAANNRAASWTIGSKPNVNSHMRCFRARRQARKPISMISEEEVQAFYEEFLEALKSGDTALLERMYADDYMLVRPNGDMLPKGEILADLRQHSMRFTSFDVNDVLIRTKGSVGILTADVRSTAVRDGVQIETHTRQLAILSKENGRITILHFQSTNILDR